MKIKLLQDETLLQKETPQYFTIRSSLVDAQSKENLIPILKEASKLVFYEPVSLLFSLFFSCSSKSSEGQSPPLGSTTKCIR